jgi:hypothetical protein
MLTTFLLAQGYVDNNAIKYPYFSDANYDA